MILYCLFIILNLLETHEMFLLLKGFVYPKIIIFFINHLTLCRSKTPSDLIVSRSHFQIFLMKTRRLLSVPLTCVSFTILFPRKE